MIGAGSVTPTVHGWQGGYTGRSARVPSKKVGRSMDDEETPLNTGPAAVLVRATDWLNGKLTPILGTAELTPAEGEDATPIAERPCPICRKPMGEHPRTIDDGHAYYHHPGDNPTNLMEGDLESPPTREEEK